MKTVDTQADSLCPACDGIGTLDPKTEEHPDPCPDCGGNGKRNYLAEAIRIAAGHCPMNPEKGHLIAIVNHCRDLTSAALILPEVAA